MMDLKRLFDHVEYRGGCWQWTGAIDTDGYGRINNKLAHREMYELLVGPAPDTLHHECENRACVNVGEHVFASTRGQNVKDGTRNRRQRCQRGHDDWYTRPDGRRYCRTCVVQANGRRRNLGS